MYKEKDRQEKIYSEYLAFINLINKSRKRSFINFMNLPYQLPLHLKY